MELVKSSEGFRIKCSEGFQMFAPVYSATFPSPEEYRKIEESEETLMRNQARLAHMLKTSTARRLLAEAQSSTADNNSDGNSGKIVVRKGTRQPRIRDIPMELQMHEESRVMKLHVIMFPVTGYQPMGYLEAHINAFIYRDRDRDNNGSIVIMHANVERCFMRLGDMMMPALLQFHLQHPIMVGTEETKDIQFILEPPYGAHNNEALENFVQKVHRPERIFGNRLAILFEALQEFEFCGSSPTHAAPIFALTFSALVMHNKIPFDVVLLRDIEIVNLAQREPEIIDMTVVFKDFKRDVLEIHSIPIKFLAGIKFRLNYGGVKYYVNSSERRDWNLLLKDIREFPKKFIDSGGWRSLDLEDDLTLAYYKDAESDLDSALRRKCTVPWIR